MAGSSPLSTWRGCHGRRTQSPQGSRQRGSVPPSLPRPSLPVHFSFPTSPSYNNNFFQRPQKHSFASHPSLPQNSPLLSLLYQQNLVVKMAFYDSRLAYELQLSRRVSLERELEYSRALEIQRIAEAKELEYREIKEIQRINEEQEFRTYQLKKNAELQEAEENLARERLMRAEKDREYQVFVEAERRSRLVREEELQIQKNILQTEQKKRSQALAASRRVEFQKQIQLKEEQERENGYVLEQQKNQEKLQKELREIDLQIGSLHDARDERKRLQLLQLEKLDQQIFKLRQQLRGSKVRQLALEQQLLQLSKLIV